MSQNSPQTSFELPPLQPQGADESLSLSQEQAPPGPETFVKSSPAQGASSPVMPPVAAPTQPAQPVTPQPQGLAAQTPAVADDNDLIEKEWVEKAKRIVAATREDPHKQNKEMSRFKADYLKKRYNKDIKLEEA